MTTKPPPETIEGLSREVARLRAKLNSTETQLFAMAAENERLKHELTLAIEAIPTRVVERLKVLL